MGWREGQLEGGAGEAAIDPLTASLLVTPTDDVSRSRNCTYFDAPRLESFAE